MYLEKLLKSNKIFITMIVCLMFLIVTMTTCFVSGNYRMNALAFDNNQSKKQYNALLNKYNEKNIKIFEDKMKETFTEDQLKSITQKYINHALYINEIKFSTSPIYIKSSATTIVLSETYDKNAREYLTDDLLKIGSVFNINYPTSLFKITTNNAQVNTSLESKDNSDSLTYSISNIKIGEIIGVEIDPLISKTLGLDDNILEIIYNGEK